MRGGARENAGRNRVSPDKKKIAKSIHVSPHLFNKIQELEIDGYDSFSSKCQYLIEEGYEAIQMHNHKDNVDSLTFIDLFAGVGGIRKGFEDKNTKCVFSSEWDKFSVKTYEANYGDIPFGDITKIDERDIPRHDVLLAGCQPFSNIGKREGFGHETQGTLFFDVLRILKYHMPKMFLLENVPGLLTIQNGETFKIILDNLEELGYSVFFDVLDAQNFGLAQVRKRVVIVGFHPDLNVSTFAFPQGNTENRVPVSSILENNPKGYSISEHLQQSYLFKKNDGKPQVVDSNSTIQVKTLVASYHKIQRLTGTFVKGGDTGLRLFSELECKRLMGFPDDFIIPVSRTQMYRQMGNSVAVPMIREVANAMKEEYQMAQQDKKVGVSYA